MRFYRQHGQTWRGRDYANATVDNVKQLAISTVENLTAKSFTPLTETLDEARRYFMV